MTDTGSLQPLSEELLREHYKLAVEEYRFNVGLSADRQKFYIGLNLALSSIVPALAQFQPVDGSAPLLSFVLLLAAFSALLGVVVVGSSHAYYRSSRAVFQDIERRLGLHDHGLGLMTTAGMKNRSETTQPSRPITEIQKIYRLVQALLIALMLFNLGAAIWLSLPSI